MGWEGRADFDSDANEREGGIEDVATAHHAGKGRVSDSSYAY